MNTLCPDSAPGEGLTQVTAGRDDRIDPTVNESETTLDLNGEPESDALEKCPTSTAKATHE